MRMGWTYVLGHSIRLTDSDRDESVLVGVVGQPRASDRPRCQRRTTFVSTSGGRLELPKGSGFDGVIKSAVVTRHQFAAAAPQPQYGGSGADGAVLDDLHGPPAHSSTV
jgi:hypothetical protein